MSQNKTKTISFFNSKGGVGKSVLTNLVANEIIFQTILKQRKNGLPIELPKVLVIDIDRQKTNADKREVDLRTFEIDMKSEEFYEYPVATQSQIRQLKKVYEHLYNQFTFTSYSIHGVNSYDLEQVTEIMEVIESDIFDYIFFDFPGTFEQEGIGYFLEKLQFLFVPTTYEKSDILGTVKFLDGLEKYIGGFKKLQVVKLVHNKVDLIRLKKCMETELVFNTDYPEYTFFNTKVRNLADMDCNTVLPISAKVDQRDGNLTTNLSGISIVELSNEIIELINKY